MASLVSKGSSSPMRVVAPESGSGITVSDRASDRDLINNFSFSPFSSPPNVATDQGILDEDDDNDKIQCILHHQYAVFVHPDEINHSMPELHRFVNRRGKMR